MTSLTARPHQPFISCVIPAYNEAENIVRFLEELHRELRRHSPHVEMIVINDGSHDDTAARVLGASKTLPVRLLDFSRNFGKEAALTAGINHADGDAVILIDADFQHPIATISEFIKQWHAGYDMAYGVRTDRKDETGLKRESAKLFYWLLDRMSTVELPADAGDFRLLDRKVVLALRELPERNRFMKGLYSWVGFNSIAVPFHVHERAGGATSFTFRHLWKLAITGLVSFSDAPLRMWTVIGLVVSSISFLFAIYVVIKTMIFGADTSGWPTIVVAIMFFGGIQLISIGVLGEYIAHIFNEVKHRPTYLIKYDSGYPASKK